MDHRKTSNNRQPFLNRTRLLVYPRLFLIAQLSILLLNFALRDGWNGGIRGIFGFDFLVFYSSGILFRQDVQNIYDIDTLAVLEESLITPTSLHGGFNINSYPPYVALLTSIFTFIPYFWAYLVWTCLSLLALFAASRWLAERLLPPALNMAGLTSNQMLVLLLSSFPVVNGLQAGQNNAFTLLLISGILINTINRKPVLAGMMAGFLIYKPQFVLGFLVLWLVWREYRALLAAGFVAAVWAGSVLLTYGIDPYIDYFNQLSSLFLLPYSISRFSNTTLVALLATLLPESLAPVLIRLSQVLMIVMLGVLAWLAYRLRHAPRESQYALLILAGLYPFITSPHVLIYDLVALVPLLVLWSHLSSSRRLLYAIIFVYLGSLLLPLFSHWLHVALVGVIPLGMLAGLIAWFRKKPAALEPAVI